MKEYILNLSEYVKTNPAVFDTATDVPCLEAIWWHYVGFYPIQSEKTKKIRREICERVSAVQNVNDEDMMDLIGSLCIEYEQLAFASGMKLGIQLMQELDKA